MLGLLIGGLIVYGRDWKAHRSTVQQLSEENRLLRQPGRGIEGPAGRDRSSPAPARSKPAGIIGPADAEGDRRLALLGWLTDKEIQKWAPATEDDLPDQVQGVAAYRHAETNELQTLILGDLLVRWDLLADAGHRPLVWQAIGRRRGKVCR